MSIDFTKFRFAIIMLSTALSLNGCALAQQLRGDTEEKKEQRKEAAEAQRVYDQQQAHKHDGKTEDDVVMEFGAPSKIEQAGSFKVFYYLYDNGASSNGVALGYQGVAIGSAKTKHHFREAHFYFKDGKCVKFDADDE